jgi:hypothetical protein
MSLMNHSAPQRNAENAETPCCKQQQDGEHADDAARDRQTRELYQALPGEPEHQDQPKLERFIPMDKTL